MTREGPREDAGGVLVLGAGSGIGRALARRLASAGSSLVLAGRSHEEMARIAADCRIRFGVEAWAESYDALNFEQHADFVMRCTERLRGPLRGLALCHGIMPDEDRLRNDPDLLRRMVDVNYTSVICLLERVAPMLEAGAWIAVVSSVAGDRGRPSNHVYGSSKAASSVYLQGLRARLAKRGVAVVDVRPGFVDTGLTWGRPGLFLVASPDRVARDILRGIHRNRPVVYTPPFWRLVMGIIRRLPDRIFNRLDF